MPTHPTPTDPTLSRFAVRGDEPIYRWFVCDECNCRIRRDMSATGAADAPDICCACADRPVGLDALAEES